MDKTNCTCKRCGESWFSAKLYLTGDLPVVCAKCNSSEWWREPMRDGRPRKKKKRG